MVNEPLLMPYRLLTATLTWKSPSSSGVPEITPLDESILKPEGRPDAVSRSGAFTVTTHGS